jgi:hypothetical protein
VVSKRQSLNHLFFNHLWNSKIIFLSVVICVNVVINPQNFHRELKVFVQYYASWI